MRQPLSTASRSPLSAAGAQIMGILNLTPDSFSDGGRLSNAHVAVEAGLAMARAGASILDVGGESTRPGAARVDAATQLGRVIKPIQALRAALGRAGLNTWISIDTTLSEVAQAALEAGADMLNDVSAGRDDPGMFELAADRGVPIALMHMQGEPATMQESPRYDEVVSDVRTFLLERAAAAERAGVPAERVVIDPGIGFGKTLAHNLALLRNLRAFVETGYPVLLGASRKGFIGKLSPATAEAASDRVGGTCAVTALAVQAGVGIIRVHDVAANRQAADVAGGILDF